MPTHARRRSRGLARGPVRSSSRGTDDRPAADSIRIAGHYTRSAGVLTTSVQLPRPSLLTYLQENTVLAVISNKTDEHNACSKCSDSTLGECNWLVTLFIYTIQYCCAVLLHVSYAQCNWIGVLSAFLGWGTWLV